MPYNEITEEWTFDAEEQAALEKAWAKYITDNNLKPGDRISTFEICHGVVDVAFPEEIR
jgi:hypothetical protein